MSIGPLDRVKALYVLVPLAVAILSRVFLLHDKISDFFGIRKRFDLEYILKPLAEGVGFPTVGPDWKVIERNWKLAMTRTFYRFASFRDPKIDTQMVRTAADLRAWYWCTVKPVVILIVASVIFAVLGVWSWVIGISMGTIGLILVGLLLRPQLRIGARKQVGEILNSGDWRTEVHSALHRIAEGNGAAADSARGAALRVR